MDKIKKQDLGSSSAQKSGKKTKGGLFSGFRKSASPVNQLNGDHMTPVSALQQHHEIPPEATIL